VTSDVDDEVRRPVRAYVGALLSLLIVFAAIDIEAWPLTGWRLFSTIRDDTQTGWVVEATDVEGDSRIVSFEELPPSYRNAAWVVAQLPNASVEKREAVCNAMLAAVVDVEPDTVSVRVARDRAQLEERDGEWAVQHDLETLHTCGMGTVS
jgi:hypothetical protein